MRYVSVFSGVEAATLAFAPLGWESVCFCEVDDFPSAVLKYRYPRVPNLGDITKVRWKEVLREWGPVDLVVGGSPCQAFSIAGLREGLRDPRGNLMLEWLRVVDEVKPEFALWENVPGVLSDKTGAFRTLLDSLQSLGYIIDMDILDAQYFGVAQRRKRVFVLGWRVETLLKKKTSTSRTITAQILGKILLDTLKGLSAESEKGHASSDCAGSSRDGLMKRMRSFGLRTEEDLLTWLKSLEGEKGRLALELKNLATRLGTKSRGTLDTEATSVFEKMEDERSFTELLWRTISAESSKKENASTISTSTSLTTRSKIFICSAAALTIARLISHWKQLDRVYCNEGLYISTLLKEFTSYAIRKNERANLFDGFDDVLSHIGREAERQEKIVRDFGNERGREIQLEPESLRWDTPSSREKSKELAAGAGGCAEAAGGALNPEGPQSKRGFSSDGPAPTLSSGTGEGMSIQPSVLCAGFKWFAGAKAGGVGYEPDASPTLTADYHNPAVLNLQGSQVDREPKNGPGGKGWCDPDENGAYTLNATDRHVVCMTDTQPNCMVSDEVCGCLSQTMHKDPPVAFAVRTKQTGSNGSGVQRDVAHTCDAPGPEAVSSGHTVRRLTPRECERLQGMPDDWTKVPYRGKTADECPDTPRYKAIGNSMAIPVMRWIGERIGEVDSI